MLRADGDEEGKKATQVGHRETFCSSQRVEDRHENIRGEKMKRRQKKESTM